MVFRSIEENRGTGFFITETQRSTEGHRERQQLGLTTARHADLVWRL
jgi:hypothetical protein